MKLSLFKISGSYLRGVYTGAHLAKLTGLKESELVYYSDMNKRLERCVRITHIPLSDAEATSAVIRSKKGSNVRSESIYSAYLELSSVSIEGLLQAIREGIEYQGYKWSLEE